MCHWFFVILLWSFGLYSVIAKSPCTVSQLGYDCMATLEDTYKLHWTLNDGDVDIAIEANTTGWVGFAFAGRPGNMAPADAVIGWVDYDGVYVRPYYIATKFVDPADEDTGVTLENINGEETGDITIVNFTRALYQGQVLVEPEEPTAINYAFGTVDRLEQHIVFGSAEILLSDLPLIDEVAHSVPPLSEPSEAPRAEPSLPMEDDDEPRVGFAQEAEATVDETLLEVASAPLEEIDEDATIVENLDSLNNLD